jgi:hypothetical protein
MTIANRVHLLTLADREFNRETKAPRRVPTKRTFKGLSLNIAKFDTAWDRKRGSAVRLTSVLLREDAETLHRRVCADEQSTRTYDGAADWLEREARYMRKVAGMLDTAVSRLNAVLGRCREERGAAANSA